MRILIEEYQYEYEDVYDVLKGLGVLQDVEGKVCLSYVGYYFNDDPDVNDVIRYLREREIVHYQRFGEGIRLALEKMDSKNFYAVNPSFD